MLGQESREHIFTVDSQRHSSHASIVQSTFQATQAGYGLGFSMLLWFWAGRLGFSTLSCFVANRQLQHDPVYRLYLKKGEVTDVMAPTLCSIVLDSGERIEARQPQLETVIPKKEGARLLIVAGELKGQR